MCGTVKKILKRSLQFSSDNKTYLGLLFDACLSLLIGPEIHLITDIFQRGPSKIVHFVVTS